MAAIVRILVLVALGFGAYKVYPLVKPHIKQTVENPQILGESVYQPIAKTFNSILPDNIKLPTRTPSPAPDNNNDSNQPTPTPNIFSSIVDDVKQKAGEVAQSQIDNLKKEAGKAFCQALLEKIKTECGSN